MVKQNFILYINSKKILKAVSLNTNHDATDFNIAFCIPEDHLICGMIIQGVPIKGEKLQNFPLKAVEKYLFEFSNIHFLLAENEFTVENTCYHWTLKFDKNLWLQVPPAVVLPPAPAPVASIFQILNFQQGTGLYIREGKTADLQAQLKIMHYSDSGVFLAEYPFQMAYLNLTSTRFSNDFNFPINNPYTGYVRILDANNNIVSNQYSIPQ